MGRGSRATGCTAMFDVSNVGSHSIVMNMVSPQKGLKVCKTGMTTDAFMQLPTIHLKLIDVFSTNALAKLQYNTDSKSTFSGKQ